MRDAKLFLIAAGLALLPPAAVLAADPAPVPRAELFAPAFTANVTFSPDGKRIAFIRPDKRGIPNLWVGPLANPAAAVPVTSADGYGIEHYRWTGDGKRLVWLRDIAGEEHNQLFVADIATRKTLDLTADPGGQTGIVKMSAKLPGELLAVYNDRDRKFRDVYRVNLATGARTKVFENHGSYTSFIADSDLKLRLALRVNQDGSTTYFRLDGDKAEQLMEMPLGDLRSSKNLHLDGSGKLWMFDSRGGDKAGVVTVDIATGSLTRIAEAKNADIIGMLTDPNTGAVLATREDPLVSEWTVRSPSVQADFDALQKQVKRPFDIVDQGEGDRTWLIFEESIDQPGRYSLWDRDRKKLRTLFVTHPDLAKRDLAKTTPVKIRSRDGLDLPSYLTLPPGTKVDAAGRPEKPLPLVLSVHGGPWLRDRFEFDPQPVFLANRGYAVLSVNFRASSGFGRNFVVAGDHEWSGKMHNDLIDAVDWAVARGIADDSRLAVFGLSYGGYSALVSLTFPPKRFACAVDLAGPSLVGNVVASMPDWWLWQRPQFAKRLGDPNIPAEAEDMKQRSPLTFADRVERPLLIGHGVNDPRVPIGESEAFVAALKQRQQPVTYVAYPGEGHVFQKAATNVSFHAVAEHFLAGCLGGKAEPYGNAFAGSAMQVRAGADAVPGLAGALPAAGK